MRLPCVVAVIFFFFFQAEDGIRDYKVTGVQTCALPISASEDRPDLPAGTPRPSADGRAGCSPPRVHRTSDRKSTRLNSSHLVISYAVFCLKKKKQKKQRSESSKIHTQSSRT